LKDNKMIARGLFILAVGVFVGGNLGILVMCLMAMAKQTDEDGPSGELAWLPAKDL
jgi:hypothetical protein